MLWLLSSPYSAEKMNGILIMTVMADVVVRAPPTRQQVTMHRNWSGELTTN